MDINTLIRYALAGLTEGARILRYVFITALLFTFFTIGASFGHLPLGDNVVWQVLLLAVMVVGPLVAYQRGELSTGWWINMAGLVIVALTGMNPTFRILGPSVGALYVLASMLLIGAAVSTGTIAGYGIAPGEATITNAPSGRAFAIVMLVTFWLVLTVFGIGVATPFTEPDYIVAILGLSLIVVPGTLYLGIGEKTTRYVLGIASTLLIIMISVAVLDSLATLRVIGQNPVKQWWHGSTKPDLCTQKRDATLAPLLTSVLEQDEWYNQHGRYLTAADAMVGQYRANKADLARLQGTVEAAFVACQAAKKTSAVSLPTGAFGWLNAILYEWPWWVSAALPLGICFLFGLFFMKGTAPSEKATGRALKLWGVWVVLLIVLRNV